MSNSTQIHDHFADRSTDNFLKDFEEVTIDPKQRDSPLLQLPGGILKRIISDENLEFSDLRSIALSSRRLFRAARYRFYKINDSRVFTENAIKGQVSVLDRCLRLCALPKDLFRTCQHFRAEHVDGNEMRRLICRLLHNYEIDKVSYDDCLSTLIWFQDHLEIFLGPQGCGFTCEAESGQEADPDLQNLITMELFFQFRLELRHDTVINISRMIQALIEHGAQVPTTCIFNYGDEPKNNDLQDIALLLDYQPSKPGHNPVSIAMRYSCPSSLLENMLQAYRNQGFRVRSTMKFFELLTSKYGKMRAPFVNPQALAIVPTECDEVLRGIYKHLFFDKLDQELQKYYNALFFRRLYEEHEGPAKYYSWEEAYYGEAVDILEEKIKLLAKYEVICETERKYLESFITKLRRVYAIGKAAEHGFSVQNNGKECWELLFDAPFPPEGLNEESERDEDGEEMDPDERAAWEQVESMGAVNIAHPLGPAECAQM